MNVEDKLTGCFKSVKDHIPYIPKVALVLGSGLGNLAEELPVDTVIPYASIRNFPLSTAPGHRGAFVFAKIADVPAVIMQGRIHYYEGYPMTDVVLPIRIMKLMGAEILFLTNAAGGVNKNFKASDFMMITDHITSFVPSPLIGKNIESLGVRFPDMTHVYDKTLQAHIKAAAAELKIPLQEGVYCQFTGASCRHTWCRCRRYEYCRRGGCSPPCRYARLRYFVYFKPRSRHRQYIAKRARSIGSR